MIYYTGSKTSIQFFLACAPLKFYHVPHWYKKIIPRSSSEKVKSRAKLRAQELKKRAYRERKKMDPNFQARSSNSSSSVWGILRTAAVNLGMVDCDVSTYEAKLEEDWFNEADQLSNRSVECLSRYMPLRLAEEVHRLLDSHVSE